METPTRGQVEALQEVESGAYIYSFEISSKRIRTNELPNFAFKLCYEIRGYQFE